MNETQRSLRIREKRQALGDYVVYVASDDPNHEPPLQSSNKDSNQNNLDTSTKDLLREQLNQIGFSNVLIQNKVLNDPRCHNIDTAIDIYTEYNENCLQNT